MRRKPEERSDTGDDNAGTKETEGADDKVKKLRRRILPPDEGCMEQARAHWMTVGKPLFSLGKLEDAVIQMAGIKRSADYTLEKKHW